MAKLYNIGKEIWIHAFTIFLDRCHNLRWGIGSKKRTVNDTGHEDFIIFRIRYFDDPAFDFVLPVIEFSSCMPFGGTYVPMGVSVGVNSIVQTVVYDILWLIFRKRDSEAYT